MIIRNFEERDIPDLVRIHQQYDNEFRISEFNNPNFIGTFVVTDNDRVISAGGVRHIPEILLVTDKNLPVKIRREALLQTLEVGSYIGRRSGHTQLHAFVQDEIWLQQLLKKSFRKTAGTSIVTDLF